MTKMGSKWIKMVVLCIISTTGPMLSSDHLPHLPTLMIFSEITFTLASSCWVLSGTLPSFMGLEWDRGMPFGNMLLLSVGMGLISFEFACCCAGEV